MVKAKRPLSALNYRGFTLAELLIALMVTSIVLAAVATLAFALGAAYETSDDTSQKQAQIRFATLRISELIRNCKLICGTTGDDIVVWKADNNPENGKIDVPEIAYIQRGNSKNYIRILEFYNCPGWLESWFRDLSKQIDTVDDVWFRDLLIEKCGKTYTPVLPQCSNVQFGFDVLPPRSRFVSISFDLVENGSVHQYQISAGLRSWAGYLLNQAGDGLVSDDD